MITTSENTLKLRCHSGSILQDVGEFIGLDGIAITPLSSDAFNVSVSPNNNPSQVSIDTESLTSADQGIYTCHIPDERNNVNNSVNINVGIYLSGFNSECLHGKVHYSRSTVVLMDS